MGNKKDIFAFLVDRVELSQNKIIFVFKKLYFHVLLVIYYYKNNIKSPIIFFNYLSFIKSLISSIINFFNSTISSLNLFATKSDIFVVSIELKNKSASSKLR